MMIASSFPDPEPGFLLQLFGCVFALLSGAWLAINIWQKLFPPKTPPRYELATKTELEKLRNEVNNALDTMSARAVERAEKQASLLSEISASIAEMRAHLKAQHEFNEAAYANINEKISNVSKSAHKRMDSISAAIVPR